MKLQQWLHSSGRKGSLQGSVNIFNHKVKAGLADLENLAFSKAARRQDENVGYTGTDANGTSLQALFFFRTGEWNDMAFAQSTAQLTEESTQQLRTRYENWRKELGLLPDEVRLSVQNGDMLRRDVASDKDFSAGAEVFQQGPARNNLTKLAS